MDGGDGTIRLGALNTRLDRGFNLEPDVSVSSPVTRQKAAAAKQLIENHYKNYLQGLQDRKERLDSFRFDSILSPLYYIDREKLIHGGVRKVNRGRPKVFWVLMKLYSSPNKVSLTSGQSRTLLTVTP